MSLETPRLVFSLASVSCDQCFCAQRKKLGSEIRSLLLEDNRSDEWISTSLLSPPASEHSHNNVNNDNPGSVDSKESEVSMVNGLKEVT